MQNPYKIHNEKLAYQHHKMPITEADVEINGQRFRYAYAKMNDSVSILAINDKNQAALVEQWRLPIQKATLEIPAGYIEAGETPLEAAKRELAEETGLHATEWLPLTAVYLSGGSLTEKNHIFLAQNLTVSASNPDQDEQITLHWLDIDLLIQKAKNGKLETPNANIAVLYYAQFLK